MSSSRVQDTKPMYKNQLYFYTLAAKKNLQMKLRNQFHVQWSKNYEMPRDTFNKRRAKFILQKLENITARTLRQK